MIDGLTADELTRCCGSTAWVRAMIALSPFIDAATLHSEAARIWWSLTPDDWQEAFAHHPQIGDSAALRKKFAATQEWAAEEQRGAHSASEETLVRLAEGNRRYQARHGYIFIVCATGKSAAEMLALLEARVDHPLDEELRTAATEQEKILHLRLDKLVAPVL